MIILGWRERVALPELGIDAMKAKIDSARRSSVLHVTSLQSFERGGGEWLRFAVRPNPAKTDIVVSAAPLKSKAAGVEGEQLQIETPISVGERTYPIELTLTTEDAQDFALIIGRAGIKRGYVIDPNRSYLVGG